MARLPWRALGGMAERTNARLLKSREVQASVGSNPTPSAGQRHFFGLASSTRFTTSHNFSHNCSKPSYADVMSGSIRQTGPNRWQIRVSAGRDPVTRRYRYVHKTVEGSKRVAQKAADDLASEVGHGKHPAGRGTVAELLEKWMLHLETQDRAASTHDPVPVGHRRPDRAGPRFDRTHQADRRRPRRLLRVAPQAGPPSPLGAEVPRRPVGLPPPGREVGTGSTATRSCGPPRRRPGSGRSSHRPSRRSGS